MKWPYAKMKELSQRRNPDVHLIRWLFQDLLRAFVREKVQGNKKIGQLSGLPAEKHENLPMWPLESQNKSLLELASHTQVSYSSKQRGFWEIHLRPYRIGTVQVLEVAVRTIRLQCCRCILSFAKEYEINTHDTVYFTDEAWFQLVGHIKSEMQN